MSEKAESQLAFNYKTIRTFVGVIAISMPIITTALFMINMPESELISYIPTSISATYHFGARDVFVGLLFFVGSFLLAYNGHMLNNGEKTTEFFAAKLASICAFCVALFPTKINVLWAVERGYKLDERLCGKTPTLDTLLSKEGSKDAICNVSSLEWAPFVHNITAITLIIVLAYFCCRFYSRVNRKLKIRGLSDATINKLKKRRLIYFYCGLTMLISAVVGILYSEYGPEGNTAIFWVEFFCLISFGVSWLVAGKTLIFKACDDANNDIEDILDKSIEQQD